MPRMLRQASIFLASFEKRAPLRMVSPSARAAIRRALLVILFEPGTFTLMVLFRSILSKMHLTLYLSIFSPYQAILLIILSLLFPTKFTSYAFSYRKCTLLLQAAIEFCTLLSKDLMPKDNKFFDTCIN